jgi:hypothetical protein
MSTKVVRLLSGGDPVAGLTPGKYAGDVFEGNPVEAIHQFFNETRDNIKSKRPPTPLDCNSRASVRLTC